MNDGFFDTDPLPTSSRYVSLDPAFPDGDRPNGKEITLDDTVTTKAVSVSLEPLSARYWDVSVTARAAHKVTINWRAGEADIQALTFEARNDGWNYRHLTASGRDQLEICFDAQPGGLSFESWLILSNSDHKPVPGSFSVRASTGSDCNCALPTRAGPNADYCYLELEHGDETSNQGTRLQSFSQTELAVGVAYAPGGQSPSAAFWRDADISSFPSPQALPTRRLGTRSE